WIPVLGTVGVLGLAVLSSGCPTPDEETFSAGLEVGNETDDDSDDDTSDAVCGNSIVEAGEQCDQGADNSESGQCTADCQIAVCGDGFVRTDYEDCDDANSDENDYCLN